MVRYTKPRTVHPFAWAVCLRNKKCIHKQVYSHGIGCSESQAKSTAGELVPSRLSYLCASACNTSHLLVHCPASHAVHPSSLKFSPSSLLVPLLWFLPLCAPSLLVYVLFLLIHLDQAQPLLFLQT